MEIWDFAALPFSLQVFLVDSEPRVRPFLAAAAGETSPPADALPAAEAAPADSPHGPLGLGVLSCQVTGELLQGATQ